MAKDQTKRLAPSVLQADKDAVAALAGITGYKPADTTFNLAAMQAREADMTQKQATETQTKAAADAARDAATASEWEYHNAGLRVKELVIGQFGGDSDQAHAIGRKKTSERKAPGPRRSQKPPA